VADLYSAGDQLELSHGFLDTNSSHPGILLGRECMRTLIQTRKAKDGGPYCDARLQMMTACA
jgi:hypothetical protein